MKVGGGDEGNNRNITLSYDFSIKFSNKFESLLTWNEQNVVEAEYM